MKKGYLLFAVCLSGFVVFVLGVAVLLHHSKDLSTIELTVLSKQDGELLAQDNQHVIYSLDDKKLKDVSIGEILVISYTGLIKTQATNQDIGLVKYETGTIQRDSYGIPLHWLDDGIFKQYYKLAYDKVKDMTLEEKIGQILLVRYPDTLATEAIHNYHVSGFVFFSKDFQNKDKTQVQKMMQDVQQISKIPLLTAVDEEGGSVVRVSSNSLLRDSPFLSSQELYNNGGLDAIRKDTMVKSEFLHSLGLNVNLAPVVDVATSKTAYIYPRTVGLNTEGTSLDAQTVIESSKGSGVSYTLKHFPGYGDAVDTHTGQAVVNENLSYLSTYYLPPFEAGIQAGAEAVLINHNLYSFIDATYPASLSPQIHNLLRHDLSFTGIVITDDLQMDALQDQEDAIVQAVLAGNDLIITSDYINDFQRLEQAVEDEEISEDLISKLAFRVIAWKYYKGLMYQDEK